MLHDLKPGIHVISEDDYHELTAISNSDLGLLAYSPAHYYAKRRDPNRIEKEPTPALIAGRILHTAILEPENFHDRFVVVPEDAPRRPSSSQRNAKNPSEDSIKAIIWWDEWERQYGDKQLIKFDDQVKYTGIANSIRNHPELSYWMAGGLAERTFIANDPETGLQLRCRADLVNTINGYTVVLDLKSTEDARPGPFGRSSYNYGYFRQNAYYNDVIELSGAGHVDLFLFVAFEKEPPYGVKLYQCTEDAVARARVEYRKILRIAEECIRTYTWPSYSTDIETLDYPAWAKE